MTRATRPLKVVLGSASTTFPGWISTDRDVLDITRPTDWASLFVPASVERILCEHVLEHLGPAEAAAALRLSCSYLVPGGVMRIAVPDAYRPDEAYRLECAPPRDGHKQFFNVDSLTSLLVEAGFQVTPLEYFDADGRFHAVAWDPADGMVSRSARFDRQEKFRRGALCYTSLILDAQRPRGAILAGP